MDVDDTFILTPGVYFISLHACMPVGEGNTMTLTIGAASKGEEESSIHLVLNCAIRSIYFSNDLTKEKF